MKKLIIFGGTSEGRELAEWAEENGFDVTLTVATDYGESLCTPGENLRIQKGRMDASEMAAFFSRENPELLIDATHPHAAEVSENIKTAAEQKGLPVMRVVRPDAEALPDGEYSEWEKDSVFYVSSAGEALEILERDDDPILLTTGSKELPQFAALKGFAKRVYARVLPQKDAILACEKAGLSGKHIIAMQGPFSKDLNKALIDSLGVGWLVTKESGVSGGYAEKMQAAAESGIRVIVISRPFKEEGLSLEETKNRLLRMKEPEEDTEHGTSEAPSDTNAGIKKVCPDNPVKLTIIGLGMGGASQLTVEALKALSEGDVIFGAKRMIDDVRPYTGDTPLIALYKADEILAYLNEHREYKKACVVFSGDTGFYSGCGDFIEYAKNPGMPLIKILPGISSFACLCARFGLREEEFTPASAHGKTVDIVSLLSAMGKVFLILDKQTTIGSVCRTLCESGFADTLIYAGVRLGYSDEELLKGRAEEFTGRNDDDLAVMAMVMEERDFEG